MWQSEKKLERFKLKVCHVHTQLINVFALTYLLYTGANWLRDIQGSVQNARAHDKIDNKII